MIRPAPAIVFAVLISLMVAELDFAVGQLLFEYRRPTDRPDVPPAQRATYRVEVR